MKRKLKSIVLSCCVVASGCATGPAITDTDLQPNEGYSRLVFYRTHTMAGVARRPPVYLNGNTEIGIVIPGGAFYHDVAPGTHNVRIDFTNPCSITLDVKVGETKYVRFYDKEIIFEFQVCPEEVTAEVGVQEVSKLSLIGG